MRTSRGKVYVYLQFYGGAPSGFSSWLAKQLAAPFELEDGEITKLTLGSGRAVLIRFLHACRRLSVDLLVDYKALLVPCFAPLYQAQIAKVRPNTLEYLVNLPEAEALIDSSLYLLKGVSPTTVETVCRFIEMDCSPQATGNLLFIHRNTVNYRIRQFVCKTGFDLVLPPSRAFVYQLLNRCARRDEEEI